MTFASKNDKIILKDDGEKYDVGSMEAKAVKSRFYWDRLPADRAAGAVFLELRAGDLGDLYRRQCGS